MCIFDENKFYILIIAKIIMMLSISVPRIYKVFQLIFIIWVMGKVKAATEKKHT